jgi:large subunit ribosomal protein L25
MEAVEISIQRRDATGKGAVRRLRRGGTVPAVFYGPKRATVHVTVDASEFARKLLHLEGSHLIHLLNSGADVELHDKMALLREVQRHPVTGDVLHADFYEVDLTERLVVSVPLHFVGKAAGVVLGGILQPILREIEVECLPTEIPEFVEVDVSPLGIHEALHIADLTLPSGVSVVGDPTRTIVTVVPPTVEEARPAEAAEAAPAEGAPAEAGAAPAAAETPAAAKPAAAKKGGSET